MWQSQELRDWFRTLIQVTIILSNAFCSCLIYFPFIFYRQNHKFSPDATEMCKFLPHKVVCLSQDFLTSLGCINVLLQSQKASEDLPLQSSWGFLLPLVLDPLFSGSHVASFLNLISCFSRAHVPVDYKRKFIDKFGF